MAAGAEAGPRGPTPLRVGVVSSVGGHLAEVLELAPLLAGCDVFLVLNDEAPWRQGLAAARSYRIVHAERDLRQLKNLVEAAAILLRERPDVLLSTGASPAVPFFLLGRLLGTTNLFVETFAAVDRPSLTGRLVRPLCDHLFVQWPELVPALPGARYCGPLFLPDPAAAPEAPGEPLGLFVALGSSPRPCRRLLGWLAELDRDGALPRPVLVQSNADAAAPGLPTVRSLPAAALAGRLATARQVICHGGAGILGTCLRLGRHPLVVPRLSAFGEHVNDHQLMLAGALARRGLATVCQSREELRRALARPAAPDSAPRSPPLPDGLRPAVAAVLRDTAARRGRRLV